MRETLAGDGDVWTPSDTTQIPEDAMVYVNSPGGNVAVKFRSGRTFTFVAYIGWLPVSVQYIMATGTTATNVGVFF